MKFGIGGRHLSSVVESTNEIIETVRIAEELGFYSAWISDDEFFRDPYTVLSACGLATRSILLSTGMTNPFTRHPAVTARAVATLQELTANRIRLGLATGGGARLLKTLHLEKREGVTRCKEYVSIVRALLSGDEVTFHGDFFHLSKVRIAGVRPVPAQIFLAGQGPTMLKTAGQIADGVVISYGGPDYLDYCLNKIEEGASSCNRTLSEIRLVGWVPFDITTDQSQSKEVTKFYSANLLSNFPEEGLKHIPIDLNSAHEIKKSFSDPITRPQAMDLITDEIINIFTAVGDATKCLSVLDEFRRKGFSEVVFWLVHKSFPDKIESLARISRILSDYP